MLQEMKKLVEELNIYNNAYYNQNKSMVSDYEFDQKFDRLLQLEKETGILLSNSPTTKVGSTVVSSLTKRKHNHPMLSLDKTKNVETVEEFIGNRKALAMLKMDGLTISLKYVDGNLFSAETRGDGEIGEDILHNAKMFKNIPLTISCKEELIVDGEAIITYEDFEKINEACEYENPRNLASGSVRQLDSGVAKKRNLKFILWKCIKGNDSNSFIERLEFCRSQGFDIVPYVKLQDSSVEDSINLLKEKATENSYPIDGIVFSYDDISYGESLGATGHHVRSQIAFKFYDTEVETILRNVEWTMGKTGVLTPTAVFDPVKLEGTTVERASLHNVSIMKSLELSYGDTITVYKANQIIPQVRNNLNRSCSNLVPIPSVCPVCGAELKITRENETENLICTNDSCEGKLLNQISNFISKSGMDIKGLSKKTIEKLMAAGLISSYLDIYKLGNNRNKKKMLTLEGFGEKKVEGIITMIEQSKDVTLEKFLCALGIKGIGSSAAKKISAAFDGDFWKLSEGVRTKFDFSTLEDFGTIANESIHDYFDKNYTLIYKLASLMRWKVEEKAEQNFSGIAVVITGKLHNRTRQELKDLILSRGGKVTDSVTAKTTCLVNNDLDSSSSKNKKAKSLGIAILTEEEFEEKYLK